MKINLKKLKLANGHYHYPTHMRLVLTVVEQWGQSCRCDLRTITNIAHRQAKHNNNLAKLDDGLDEIPTVKVRDKKQKQKHEKTTP
jgi:hypothetical protein